MAAADHAATPSVAPVSTSTPDTPPVGAQGYPGVSRLREPPSNLLVGGVVVHASEIVDRGGWVRRAEEGDFQAFVAVRLDRWRRTAYLMCLDWHTADDVVSITVAKLFRNWRKVVAADNPDAYAQRVLSRSWLDEQGRASRREQPQAELPDVAWSGPEQITDRQALAQLLTSLGPRQRAVVVLRFYLGYSVQETAEMLKVSVGTVKSQSARGLETLRTAAAQGN